MRSSGHLLRRAGREFAKNLIWMVVAFGALAAILVATTAALPLVGVMAFVGAASAVMSAIVTGVVIGTNVHDETPMGGQQHHYPYPGGSPGPGGDWRDGGGWDGGGGDGGGGGGG